MNVKPQNVVQVAQIVVKQTLKPPHLVIRSLLKLSPPTPLVH